MKTIYFTDQNVSSYNIYNGISQLTNQNFRHATMFTYSHASTPLGQSERAYYLTYFIN